MQNVRKNHTRREACEMSSANGFPPRPNAEGLGPGLVTGAALFRAIVRDTRCYIAELFLSWALDLYPKGSAESIDLSRTLLPFFCRRAEELRR